MQLTVIGSSDAFGSGGRLQTCFHVAHTGGAFLIDCGATALIGLAREGIDPNEVDTIFITHLHGDHFGGLVWWLIHAVHIGKRTRPLVVTGPAGIEERFTAAAEALFPGSSRTPRSFDLTFRTYREREPMEEGGVTVVPFEVSHPSGAPPYALRFEVDSKVLTFSGDTEWVESLPEAARGADLFITECFAFKNEARYHLNWRTIEANLPRIAARRVLLTHMGPEMLANQHEVSQQGVHAAYDGLKVEL
ncbi:MAG: MBL fold metallo-hydrolase [Deltaproteobacteria bacterium]